jgi:hypothetical protein
MRQGLNESSGNEMGCSACEKRRRMLKALKDKKKLKGQQVQAAAIGAVLAVSEAAGKLIHGEVEDGREDGSGTTDPPG